MILRQVSAGSLEFCIAFDFFDDAKVQRGGAKKKTDSFNFCPSSLLYLVVAVVVRWCQIGEKVVKNW